MECFGLFHNWLSTVVSLSGALGQTDNLLQDEFVTTSRAEG